MTNSSGEMLIIVMVGILGLLLCAIVVLICISANKIFTISEKDSQKEVDENSPIQKN